MSTLSLIWLLIGLSVAVFAGVLWAIRRQRFLVPNDAVNAVQTLAFSTRDVGACGATCAPLAIWEEVALLDDDDGQHLTLTFGRTPAEVVAIRWSDSARAAAQWSNYYRRTYYDKVRQLALSNTVFKPYFIVGRFGLKPAWDLAAWSQGRWFFAVIVPTTIPAAHRVRLEIERRLLTHLAHLGCVRD
ncbi:hypothetical protein [Candidatus Thiodictyon syntrophicum]|jgi:hypothetical protein|uniref:hypothetical protein n=1 Tax=Candidatus Thiodictyon syntrophicum TaxID=1166950 RepID=UPI0012FE6A56|nr:hypothetical protein [Candidatus Thiodictyon syntrophicum]